MSFLSGHIRLLVHIRRRLYTYNQFGLCLGAGVSAGLGFPTWSQLIERIARTSRCGRTESIRL